MRKTWIPLLLAVCLFSPATTYAGFGTGIGISFPASGSSTVSSGNTYAALQFKQITEELTLQERHGHLLMELKVSNNSDVPYNINHRSGQVYDFLITDKNGKKYMYDDYMTLPPEDQRKGVMDAIRISFIDLTQSDILSRYQK